MNVRIKKINDIQVKKINLNNEYNPKQILGYNMFSEIFANVFLCGRKKQGKTCLISNILDECANKSTIVVFFCATINKDLTYSKIIENLDKRGIIHHDYEDIIDDEGNNIIDEYLSMLIERAKQEKQEKQEAKELKQDKKNINYNPIIKFQNDITPEEVKEEKKEKKKIKAPDYLIVMDDLGDVLRSKSIYKLLKMNRHFFCKVILSAQYVKDILPKSMKQIDYALIFRSFDEEKLHDLHRALDLSISLDEFIRIYKYATKEPYNFLYTSSQNEFRKNFNQSIELK